MPQHWRTPRPRLVGPQSIELLRGLGFVALVIGSFWLLARLADLLP